MSADVGIDHATEGRHARHRLPRARRLVAAAVVLVALLVAAYALYAGMNRDRWQTVWHEAFDGSEGQQPSNADWQFDTGTSYPGGAQQWGTGEIQTYTADPANASFDGDGH